MDEDKKSDNNPFSDLNLNPSTPSLVVKLEILETEEMEKLPNFVSQAGKQRKKGVKKDGIKKKYIVLHAHAI